MIVVIVDGAAWLCTRMLRVTAHGTHMGEFRQREAAASLAGERVSAPWLCTGWNVRGPERLPRSPASSSRNLDSDPDRSVDRGAIDGSRTRQGAAKPPARHAAIWVRCNTWGMRQHPPSPWATVQRARDGGTPRSGGMTRMPDIRKSRKMPTRAGPGAALLDPRRAGRRSGRSGPVRASCVVRSARGGRLLRLRSPYPVSLYLVSGRWPDSGHLSGFRTKAGWPRVGDRLVARGIAVAVVRGIHPRLYLENEHGQHRPHADGLAEHPVQHQAARALIGGSAASDARTRPGARSPAVTPREAVAGSRPSLARGRSAQAWPGSICVRIRGVRRWRAQPPGRRAQALRRAAARALPPDAVQDWNAGFATKSWSGLIGHARLSA
jgi:hypothetical protein